MTYTPYGAAREVTGSKHLLEHQGDQVLLDCGLWQGRRQESRQRNSAWPFEPSKIKAVIISHAHLDHVGMLPILVRAGYRGPIYATPATRDIAELILLDAAHLQEQDADYAGRHGVTDMSLSKPIFGQADIAPVMNLFKEIEIAKNCADWLQISNNFALQLHQAGHILGSAMVMIRPRGDDSAWLYTGDLGREHTPLLTDPHQPVTPVSHVICESTYGNRIHHPIATVEKELIEIIRSTVANQAKILLPAFSLGRTQELIYLLHRLTDQLEIPRLPIVVDSPLAARITDVFTHHQQEYDQESHRDFSRPHEDPLVFRNLRFTHNADESKALNSAPGPLVIISASGMATGGRVMHHLRNLLPDPKANIIFTGYQADHTPGRRLLKGATAVQIFGELVPVRAQIKSINDLSAHADGQEIRSLLNHLVNLKNVFLVHGELDRANDLRQAIITEHPDWQVTIPVNGQAY